MHILLVDDDVVNQKVAAQIINRWGLKVDVARSGEEGIQKLQQQTFDVVLMDLAKPGIDGVETAKKIRSIDNPRLNAIPILAYTASPSADGKEKAEKLGMNDILSKPLIPEELLCKLNQCVHSKSLEPRPLKIKFDLYADSDPEFKLELVSLMISNLRELQYASYRAFYNSDVRVFQTVTHKVKSTLLLLDDHQFLYIIDQVKDGLQPPIKPDALRAKIIELNLFCESIIKTLDQEMTVLKTDS